MNWDRIYTWYWVFWVVVGFGVPETIALVGRQSQRTLSETVWRAETPGPTAAHYFVAVFMVWLALHMVLRLFR